MGVLLMKKTIYIKEDNQIKIYNLNFNETEFKKIQNKIDEWNDKGPLKRATCFDLELSIPNGHIEIVSKKYIGQGDRYYDCCGEMDKANIYEYSYYEYKTHPLSYMCDQLLSSNSNLENSANIKAFLDYEPKNIKETDFLKELISTFKLKKTDYNEIIKDNSFSNPRIIYLKNLIELLFNNSNNIETNIFKESFDKDVNRKIKSMENMNAGFFSDELDGQDFRYSESKKRKIKKHIKSELPTRKALIEQYNI
jgi:hypothetical protein